MRLALAAYRLDHHIDLGVLQRHRREGALVVHFFDIRLQVGEPRRQVGERARHIAQLDPDPREPSASDHSALEDSGQQDRARAGVDVADRPADAFGATAIGLTGLFTDGTALPMVVSIAVCALRAVVAGWLTLAQRVAGGTSSAHFGGASSNRTRRGRVPGSG